jgi:hypothetical protein
MQRSRRGTHDTPSLTEPTGRDPIVAEALRTGRNPYHDFSVAAKET